MPTTCTVSDQVIPVGIEESQIVTNSKYENQHQETITFEKVIPLPDCNVFLCKDVKCGKTVRHTKHFK